MASFTRTKERWYYSFIPYKAMEGSSALTIPFFVTDVLGEHLGWVGLVAAISSVAAVPGSILWGLLSDKLYRRKVFIIISFFGSGMVYLLMGFVSHRYQLATLAALYGLFFSAAAPVSSVLIMATHSRTKWDGSFGKFNKIGGFAFVVGLLTSAAFLWFSRRFMPYPTNLRTVFVLFGVITLVSAMFANLIIPEPRRTVERKAYPEVTGKYVGHTVVEKVRFLPFRMLFYLPHLRVSELRKAFNRQLLLFFLCTFLAFSGATLVYAVFPIFLKEELMLAPAAVFLFYVVRSSASALIYERAGEWSHRFGFLRTERAAIATRSVLFFLLAGVSLAGPFHQAWVFILVLELFSGPMFAVISVAGSTIVANLSTKGLEGEAVGAYNAMIGCAQILAALASGYIALWLGYSSVFMMAASLLLLGYVVLLVMEPGRISAPSAGQPGA